MKALRGNPGIRPKRQKTMGSLPRVVHKRDGSLRPYLLGHMATGIPVSHSTFNPMERLYQALLVAALLATGCAKEEVKEYTVSLEAKCRDCIVHYAAGAARSQIDTLLGNVDPSTGDTTVETANYQVIVKGSDNLFFRACRIRTDTAYGDMELKASGGIQPLSDLAGPAETCAEINQPVQVQ